METVNTFKLNESDVTVMVDDNGEYFYCVSGTLNGIYSESDDIGGFTTQEQAESDAQDYFNRLHEEA